MWVHLGCQNFIAKKILHDETSSIFVSDFIRIWHKSLTDNEIISISQKLNPLLEASVEKLKNLVFNLLEDGKVPKEVNEESSNVLLKLKSNIMGVKFRFEILLNEGNGEMLYKEFTTPLLLVLMNTKNREKKLIEIIKKKDAEIKEYKQEYGIKSNYMATKPFSKKEFYDLESTTDVPWDIDLFLDRINMRLLLSVGEDSTAGEEKPPVEVESDKNIPVDKNSSKLSVFGDKNLNKNKGSKPNILLDNKVIKKRKSHNEGFKIKF